MPSIQTQLFYLISFLSLPTLYASEVDASAWKLHWQEEFDKPTLNTKVWNRCTRGKADWKNTMSNKPELLEISKDGFIRLKGIQNNDANDSAPFLTAGLDTKGKFTFQYGKVQIRARFKSAQGAWPALWMLGEKGHWPSNGEIDLMEHLNFDDKVYQTVHSTYTKANPSNAKPWHKNSRTTNIQKDKWNTYGCEWDAEKITFTVNGKPTFTYPRLIDASETQYPFQQPFYLLITMQVGGKWVNQSGPTAPSHFPAHMDVDWIRVYKKSN